MILLPLQVFVALWILLLEPFLGAESIIDKAKNSAGAVLGKRNPTLAFSYRNIRVGDC